MGLDNISAKILQIPALQLALRAKLLEYIYNTGIYWSLWKIALFTKSGQFQTK